MLVLRVLLSFICSISLNIHLAIVCMVLVYKGKNEKTDRQTQITIYSPNTEILKYY